MSAMVQAVAGGGGDLQQHPTADPLILLPHEIWCEHILPALDAPDKRNLRGSCQSARALVNATSTSATLPDTGNGSEALALAHSIWQLLAAMPRLQRLELGSSLHPIPVQWFRIALLQRGYRAGAWRGIEQLAITIDVDGEHLAHEFELLARLLPSLRFAKFHGALPCTLGSSLAAHCRQLEGLELVMASFSAMVLEGLAELRGLRWLRVHGLSSELLLKRSTAELAMARPLQQAIMPLLPHLEDLQWDAPWTWDGLASWAAAAPAGALPPVLTRLYFENLSRQPAAPTALGPSLSALTDLHLPGVQLTDAVWGNVLAQLPNLANLLVLDLAVRNTAPAPLLPSIRWLCVDSDTAPLPLVRCLRGMPGLACLELCGYLIVPWAWSDDDNDDDDADVPPADVVAASIAALFEAERLLLQTPVEVVSAGLQVRSSAGGPAREVLAAVAAVGAPLLQLGRRVIVTAAATDNGVAARSSFGQDEVRCLAAAWPLAERVDFRNVALTDLAGVVQGLQRLPALNYVSMLRCDGIAVVHVQRWARALSLAREERAAQARGGPSAGSSALIEPKLTLEVDRCPGIGVDEAEQLMRRALLGQLLHPCVALDVQPHPGPFRRW